MKTLLLMGAALVLGGPPPDARVEITARGFSPMIVEVNAGRTVVWTNADSADHTVTEASDRPLFDSGRLPPGGTFAYTFVRPGRYAFRSTLDASMTGRIIVQPAP